MKLDHALGCFGESDPLANSVSHNPNDSLLVSQHDLNGSFLPRDFPPTKEVGKRHTAVLKTQGIESVAWTGMTKFQRLCDPIEVHYFDARL
jgi:hypothetical protein